MLTINQKLISKDISQLQNARISQLQNGCVILVCDNGKEIALTYADVYNYYKVN
jgi:hypothetical protein